MIELKDLPGKYIESMKELLGDEFNAYIESLGKKHVSGLRVNNLKISNEELLKLLDKKLRPVPWVTNGFYTNEDERLSKNPLYHAGLYYLQEPSAMTTASLSGVKPGDKVLDLCAAPGGKSTELAALLKGEGILYSNDVSSSRAKALLKNIELFGAGNAVISSEEAFKLETFYTDYFDKIIIDAPCSGEGMFRKDRAVLSAYEKRGSEYFAPIQKNILSRAANMLAVGGEIIYSTCTFSRVEDEDIIMDFLESNKDFELIDIPLKEGFTNSHILCGTVRLFPHKLEGEGHFIAKLKKTGVRKEEEELKKRASSKQKNKLPKEAGEFLKNINREFEPDRIMLNKEYIYYLPENVKLHDKIHYLRTGLLLGRINHSRFEPSQALAMNLKMEEWDNPLDLKLSDDRVLRYLKGESLEESTSYKGYRLVCLEGYPLGFIKQDNFKCKNKYYLGWRIG